MALSPIHKVLDLVGKRLNQKIGIEYVRQGHGLTGEFVRELTHEVKKDEVTGKMLKRGIYLDKGVRAGRIPYSGTGGGGKSKYIQALIKYARLRFGLSGKAAVSRAFQIANAHKSEGMPTSGSRRFSKAKNSRRTGFLTKTLLEQDRWIETQIEKGMGQLVDLQIKNMLDGSNT